MVPIMKLLDMKKRQYITDLWRCNYCLEEMARNVTKMPVKKDKINFAPIANVI